MMIGRRWTELMRAKAAQGGNDYVLIELEEALKHNKVIAPICIRGAKMPPMPPPLKAIAPINAQFVSDGIHLLNDVKRIMNGFEAELERRGAPRSVSNPASQQQMADAQTHSSGDGLEEMLDQFADAIAANDLPQALISIAQLRVSGQAIPAEFELDRRETELQARLREEADHRRRREAADFQYKFVRRMIKLGDPAEKIKAAVNTIRKILAAQREDRAGTVVLRRLYDELAASTPAAGAGSAALLEPRAGLITSRIAMHPPISWSALADASVGVWGLGVEGRASIRRLRTMGCVPVLVDDAPARPPWTGSRSWPPGREASTRCSAAMSSSKARASAAIDPRWRGSRRQR